MILVILLESFLFYCLFCTWFLFQGSICLYMYCIYPIYRNIDNLSNSYRINQCTTFIDLLGNKTGYRFMRRPRPTSIDFFLPLRACRIVSKPTKSLRHKKDGSYITHFLCNYWVKTSRHALLCNTTYHISVVLCKAANSPKDKRWEHNSY